LCPLESGGISITDRPLYILNKSIGNRVIVELRNKREYRGVLVGYDPHMNLVLKTAEEIHDNEIMRKLELVIVRGDNVVYISP
jgi:small nuclear ribonucleoprotein